MDELGFDFNTSVGWFLHQQEQPYVLVKLTAAQAQQLANELAVSVRRSYITDAQLTHWSNAHGMPQADILGAKLPDPGSTMAGDFGELLCYVYQSTKELPDEAIGAKKWRLKQDRTKPAPRSDVVHFLMPNRPNPSAEDGILCAEVKLKSTAGQSTPIASAIADCTKDRTSRLAETLVWLRERAMAEDLGDIDIPLLDRFIHLVDHPPVAKRFRAVAVVCESLLNQELLAAPAVASPDFTLLVIAVPNLKQTYEAVFEAARAAVPV
ncbi:Hachiman antiphage defense system protein HamA [Cupriavidus necator]